MSTPKAEPMLFLEWFADQYDQVGLPSEETLRQSAACISHGCVAQKGRDYCRLCSFYRKNAARVDPFDGMGQALAGESRNRGKFMAGVSS